MHKAVKLGLGILLFATAVSAQPSAPEAPSLPETTTVTRSVRWPMARIDTPSIPAVAAVTFSKAVVVLVMSPYRANAMPWLCASSVAWLQVGVRNAQRTTSAHVPATPQSAPS